MWSGGLEGRNRPQLANGLHTNNPRGLHSISQKPQTAIRADGWLHFPKLNYTGDHHQIVFVAPKEPIRIEKVLVDSPSYELKAEAKQL